MVAIRNKDMADTRHHWLALLILDHVLKLKGVIIISRLESGMPSANMRGNMRTRNRRMPIWEEGFAAPLSQYSHWIQINDTSPFATMPDFSSSKMMAGGGTWHGLYRDCV